MRRNHAIMLREVILGPLCELPFKRVREMVNKAYPEVDVIKARLAFRRFGVVPDRRFLLKDYHCPTEGTITKPSRH